MKLVQRALHLFGAHWWTPATTSSEHWYCRWCGQMARKFRPCTVHYTNGALRSIDYRYVRNTICTCYPITVGPPVQQHADDCGCATCEHDY